MKNLHKFILIISLVLILASFIAYGVQAAKYNIPAGASEEEILQLTAERGLDKPLAVQFGTFLMLFFPGIIFLGAFGVWGFPRPDFQHTMLTKVFMVLMLITNAVISIIYLLRAPAATDLFTLFWWLVMALSMFGLSNFLFILAVWNGRRWGLYGFAVATLATFVINIIVSGLPFFTALFLFSSAVVLIWLVWPVIWQMD